MRPIDADAIPKEFLEYEFDGKWNGCTIKDLIDDQPTIQPEKAQLSQEGTTSDTISRQAVIDELRKFKPEIIPYEKARIYVEETVETMYDRIVELPTVQPERKKGEWIEISSINHTYKCSECGRLLVNVADGRNNVSKHYPYCHCGADMKGGSNE